MAPRGTSAAGERREWSVSEPADAVELRAALLRLRRASGIPIAFGGVLLDPHRLRIAQLSGAQTSALQGLAVCVGNGLGGKAMALGRPCAVTDYHEAPDISDEYDGPVLPHRLALARGHLTSSARYRHPRLYRVQVGQCVRSPQTLGRPVPGHSRR
ncbi:LuxR-family transcriptional regulator, partial [Streptomyces clavuligerus]